MKQKLRAYLPIWFVLMVPPLVLLLLCYNFILSGLALMLSLFTIKQKDVFTKYSKNIGKVWFVALILDIISLIILMVPELFYKNDFLMNNLLYPLEHNPYCKFLSFLYMILLFFLIFFIGYKLIKKIIANKMNIEIKERQRLSFLITIFIIPYLFFIPTTYFINPEKSTLEDFRGTIMNNNKDIVTIMKYLNVSDYISSYVLDTHKEPYSIYLYLNKIEYNSLLKFEQDAAIFFNIIDDVNEVVFVMDNKKYYYSINDINKIFKDIKELSLVEIENHYKDKKYQNYIYYGNIDGYSVFDISEYCEEEVKELFIYNDMKYFISCTSVDKIMFYSDKDSFSLKEAIETDKISKESLINSYLNIMNDIEHAENYSK